LSFARYVTNVYDLVIGINGSNSITIDDHFSSLLLETIRVNDGTGDVDMTAMDYTTYGNGSNNVINGITSSNFNGGAVADTLYGYAGNDTLSGYNGDDILYGGEGTDTLTGGNGDDILDGGAGNDTLNGQTDDDLYYFYAGGGLDTVNESGGVDTLWITGGLTINDISMANVSTYHAKLVVTASTDEIILNNLRHPTTAYRVDLLTFDDGFTADLPGYLSWMNGTSINDVIAGGGSAEVLIGFDGNDTMTGGGGDDHAHGGAGHDSVDGGAGADMLYGGAGDDTIIGGTEDDIMNGGDGVDTADYSSDGAAVTVNLTTGTATDGHSDSDTLISIENITDSGYNDSLTGDSQDNLINGGNGNDILYGLDGLDTLYGGAGADSFIFMADSAFNDVDIIGDFDVSTDDDILDLSDLLGLYDPMTDIITDFIQITTAGSDSHVSVDADGGANNFVQIATLTGITGLTDEAALVTSGNLVV